jgi:AcrR family transcriptional regulator
MDALTPPDPTIRLSAHQRRDLILRKSAELLSELGYHDASTKKLAFASGVTEPVLYQHFSSKKELFIAVVRETGQLFSQSFKQQASMVEDSSEITILHRTLTEYYALARSQIGIRNIVFEAMAYRDDDVSAAVHQNIQEIARFVREMLAIARQQGSIGSAVDVDAATWNYVSMVLLVHVSLLSHEFYGHDQASFQRMADFWLHALAGQT